MKVHSTNYYNSFIKVAEDCPIQQAEMPPVKEGKTTVANLQFDMIYDHPYKYTSDDVFFQVHAIRKEIPKREWKEAREQFFSKGQPCFRASPLTKRYGWGIHSDEEGKIAMIPMDSQEYQKLSKDKNIQQTTAMASKRKK